MLLQGMFKSSKRRRRRGGIIARSCVQAGIGEIKSTYKGDFASVSTTRGQTIISVVVAVVIADVATFFDIVIF